MSDSGSLSQTPVLIQCRTFLCNILTFASFVLFTDSNPEKVYPEWYSVLMASWIFFGLAWLALLINHSIDILERLNSYCKRLWAGPFEGHVEKPQGAEGEGTKKPSE